MKRGKAAGLDELTIEHLAHCHPVLFAILATFFNIIMSVGYVPHWFRLRYTVQLLKADSVSSTKAIDNYRAISISPIISKNFARCILKKYSKLLRSSPNKFDFKKGSSFGQRWKLTSIVSRLALFHPCSILIIVVDFSQTCLLLTYVPC